MQMHLFALYIDCGGVQKQAVIPFGILFSVIIEKNEGKKKHGKRPFGY